MFFYEWNRTKKFLSFSNFDRNRIQSPWHNPQTSYCWKQSSHLCIGNIDWLTWQVSYVHFLYKIKYMELSRNLENWLILKFVFTHCKAVKVSQNDQVQMSIWFTSVFLMIRKELRSFSHYQILTWITYPDLSRKLENWLILAFAFIQCKTVKVSQNDPIQM